MGADNSKDLGRVARVRDGNDRDRFRLNDLQEMRVRKFREQRDLGNKCDRRRCRRLCRGRNG